MSQEIREKALSAAVAVAGPSGNYDSVIKVAGAFEAYIIGGAEKSAAKSAEKSASPKAPAKAKVADTAPAKTAKKSDEIDPDLKKAVGDKVNELLKANLRDEAIALLASFEGAQSATGIVKQGQEAVESFMAQADELLGAASGNLAD